jgi:hypothetical protein
MRAAWGWVHRTGGRLFFSAKALLVISWACLLTSLIGWPLSALTWAKDEPQFVLGLSWMALIIGSYNTIITAMVNKEVRSEEEPHV